METTLIGWKERLLTAILLLFGLLTLSEAQATYLEHGKNSNMVIQYEIQAPE